MHYEAKGNAGLTRPVLDLERGYLVTPMARGLRLTTGAEFARRDDPPSPAHLERVEPYARELFPIGARKDAAPWLGRRPCLPDMRPIIGPFPGKKGLWLDFGHHHLGLTLGPITGRLLAEHDDRRGAVRRSRRRSGRKGLRLNYRATRERGDRSRSAERTQEKTENEGKIAFIGSSRFIPRSEVLRGAYGRSLNPLSANRKLVTRNVAGNVAAISVQNAG